MKKIKIGLLPLYIKLYDDLIPGLRDRFDPFYEKIASLLEQQDLEVVRTPFCRVRDEFKTAVEKFEQEKADCIVTLHLAYSPSLESEKALAKTRLPIVVLDTTETFEFGPDQNPDEINYNHGIHGVMDMCNLLRRNGKPYAIAAGHYENSNVIIRAAGLVKAAAAANALRGSKVGVFGDSFDGMGDFLTDEKELKNRFDVKLVKADAEEMKKISASVTDIEIAAEKASDKTTFDYPEELDEGRYNTNIRACLAIRKWINKYSLNAFSVNFLKVSPSNGLSSMPFIEACKEMSRGIGYAGEGDSLTAAFTGALLQYFPETSFVEIFCPDWKNNTLLLSHMGEMNYAVADGKPQLRNVSFNYTDAEPPIVGYSRFKGGKAIFANVYKDESGFNMLLSNVEMLSVKNDNFNVQIRGWMHPVSPVDKFLKNLSEAGATHHSILVYGATAEQLRFFAENLEMKVKEI